MSISMSISISANLLLLMLAGPAAAPAGSALELSPPRLGEQDRSTLPFRLFVDTLRVPFGGDWGGETFLYTPINDRLSVGLFMRAWNEAICVSPSCQDRAVEAGVELRYQIKPGLDLGLGMGLQRGAGVRPAPSVLPRVHLKF
jgi:hypothetical protein